MNLTKPQKLIYDMERFAGGSINVICGCMLLPGIKPEAELIAGVNRVFQLNDALRIRISEEDGKPSQQVIPYTEKNIEVLHFASKAELDSYAQKLAETPFDFYGDLCNIQVVILPDQYGLLVKFHHIVGDAWTIALIGTQFNTIMNGEEPSACSYCEYVESEKEYMESQRYENDRTFFLEQFKKCDEVTYLSEKQAVSYSATRKTFVLDAGKTQQIKDYATHSKSSAYTLFMTALAIYMNRTNMNAEKFYLGTAVLNRSGVREKRTMGMFVNTVPMLIELENSSSFAENLTAMGKTIFSAFRHQKFNYGDVLSAIRKEYNFSEKLYDVMLSYQNATITGGDCETTWYHCGMQNESLQIHIDDRDREGVFRIHYDYQTDKFTAQEIDALHNHLMTLLQDAIRNDTKKLYELELLPSEEKQKVLFDFNDTAMDYPKDKCVHQLFEEQVTRTPNKVAVIACDKTLTYAQLNEQSNCIAHSLVANGIHTGDIVAFALSRKSYLISTIFGILKSGAAYLPVDPDYPQERIDYILKDSNAKLFITDCEIEDYLNNVQTENPSVAMTSEDLCYCIYTSGSTGTPKGTLLKHKGIVNLVTNLNIYSDLSNCKRIGFMTTITFDVATQEILTALLNGFTGVLMPERKETRSDVIIDGICKNRIDVMYATPTYFESLTDTVEKAEKLLSTIKVVCLAGEKFYLNQNVLAVKDKYNVLFENQYGPVELHVIATTATVTNLDFDLIGKPVHNDKAYIVDQYMQPTPIGVTGELCVAGDGVGVGYLNRPELTAEKFIDNSFGEGKLYKTGDLAYWREDGNIAYVGRNDFQVKIRGLRIELGEIENVMNAFAGIQQSVVTADKDKNGHQYLACYYTAADDIDEKDLRKAIGTKLPKYMIPHYFVKLDSMPLTTSGKVSRKALPKPNLSSLPVTEYTAPKNESEESLCRVFEEILHLDRVSTTDNFFDLGGDSLLSITLITKIEQVFNKQISTKDVMENATVADLTVFLGGLSDTTEHIETLNVDEYPITPQQMGVYTACQAALDSYVYNMPIKVTFPDTVDITKLKTAIMQVFHNHKSLQTYFESRDNGIYGVYDPKCELVIDEYIKEENFVRVFDLGKAPLFRVGFNGKTMFVDMHHIISDGTTIHNMLKEITAYYENNQPICPEISYGDYAVYLGKKIGGNGFDAAIDFYRDMLKFDFEPMELPEKHTHETESKGKTLQTSIPKDLFDRCKGYARAHNVTDTAFFLSVYGVLLTRYCLNEQVLTSVTLTNRERAQCCNTSGMFVNTVPVMFCVDEELSFGSFTKEINALLLNIYKYSELPFITLAEALKIDNKKAMNTSFVYQGQGEISFMFDGQNIVPEFISTDTAKFDMTVEIVPNASGATVRMEYNSAKLADAMAKRILDSFGRLLMQIVKNASQYC